MPNILVEIPDVENSISRPVAAAVSRQLSSLMGIDYENVRLMYAGDSEESYQKGSTLDSQNNLKNRTTLPFSNQMTIVVTEQTFREAMNLSFAKKTDNLPFFIDDALQVTLRPAKAPTEVNLDISYRFDSKAQAIAWRNRIETKLMTYGDMNLHTASYHYMVPLWIMDILMEIHSLRETVKPYGEDFANYLAGHITSQATVVAALDGKSQSVSIAETQIRIQGLYDFEIVPEKGDKADNGSAWIVNFSYKYTYDKPISVNALYPVMVHNQLIDDRYIVKDTAANLDNHRKSFSLSGNAMHYFERPNEIHLYKETYKPITVPVFDEFRPNVQYHATSTIYSVLLQVDESDLKTLYNAKDIGDYALDPDILEFILDSEWKWLTVPYKTLFNISLYKNSCIIDSNKITCDNQLNITSLEDLDPRVIHQVRFSIYTDIDTIDIEALKRMKKYPKALIKIILAMGTSMGQLKLIAQRVDLTKYLKDYLPDTGYPMSFINKNRFQHNTVQTHYVVTDKRSEYTDPKLVIPGIKHAYR